MKMVAPIAVVFVPSGASVTQAAGPMRAQNQRLRIARGGADGSLTRGEAKVLWHEQQTIRELRRDALAADSRVGPTEAGRLDGARERASGDISRLRHNDRER